MHSHHREIEVVVHNVTGRSRVKSSNNNPRSKVITIYPPNIWFYQKSQSLIDTSDKRLVNRAIKSPITGQNWWNHVRIILADIFISGLLYCVLSVSLSLNIPLPLFPSLSLTSLSLSLSVPCYPLSFLLSFYFSLFLTLSISSPLCLYFHISQFLSSPSITVNLSLSFLHLSLLPTPFSIPSISLSLSHSPFSLLFHSVIFILSLPLSLSLSFQFWYFSFESLCSLITWPGVVLHFLGQIDQHMNISIFETK